MRLPMHHAPYLGFSPSIWEFGFPLDHPWFLEWVGALESARLLDRGPGAWFRSLSRMQSIDAARQLYCAVCLMTSNLNILDQYVLCLQGSEGTATKLIELPLDRRDFPSAAVAAAAPLPRVRRASVHMEAMGLWGSSLDPVDRTWLSPLADIDITGPPACSP